jgi:hypothetical protein
VRRVLPEEVLRAYRETGVEPRAGAMGIVKDGEIKEACGLGAWGLHEGLWDASIAVEWDDGTRIILRAGYDRLELLLEPAYIRGFAAGFDFHMNGGTFFAGHESTREGFQDGYDAAKRLPELISDEEFVERVGEELAKMVEAEIREEVAV